MMKLELNTKSVTSLVRDFLKILLVLVTSGCIAVMAEPNKTKSSQTATEKKVATQTLNAKANSKCGVGGPKRFAVIEAGRYRSTPAYFSVILSKLAEDKYIRAVNIESIPFDDAQIFRDFIGNKVKGECIEFPRESVFILNYDNASLQSAIEKLQFQAENKKIDYILSIGDLATRTIAKTEPKIPVFGINIVASDSYYVDKSSGKRIISVDNVDKGAQINRYKNVYVLNDSHSLSDYVKIFSRFFVSKRIGLLKSTDPRMNDILDYDGVIGKLKLLNVEYNECEGNFFDNDVKLSRREFARCMTYLSSDNKLDSVYIGEMGDAVDIENFYSQIKPLLQVHVPIFTFDYMEMVKAGALFGIYDKGMNSLGAFTAEIIENLVDGKKINELNFIVSMPMYVGFNLKTSGLIRWKPPFDILVSVDDLFSNIDSK